MINLIPVNNEPRANERQLNIETKPVNIGIIIVSDTNRKIEANYKNFNMHQDKST